MKSKPNRIYEATNPNFPNEKVYISEYLGGAPMLITKEFLTVSNDWCTWCERHMPEAPAPVFMFITKENQGMASRYCQKSCAEAWLDMASKVTPMVRFYASIRGEGDYTPELGRKSN